jgi:hypothetical protein
MLGRAQPGQVEVKFETGKQLTQRFENVQRTQKEFWKRWIEEVFPEMLKQHKWTRDKKDLNVGDIVLRKDETAAGQTYKYARVTKVHVSTDGRVRAADFEYKLPGEAVFRTTTRPIRKLVMVLPVEEQAAASGQEREGVTRPEEPAPLATGKQEPPQEEEIKAVVVRRGLPSENSLGSIPRPTKKKQRRPKLAVKCKKRDLPEKSRRTGTNNNRGSAKGGGGDSGCESGTAKKRKAEENPRNGFTGSAQGKCSGSR